MLQQSRRPLWETTIRPVGCGALPKPVREKWRCAFTTDAKRSLSVLTVVDAIFWPPAILS